MVTRTGILKNSPLIYVLASIRFASWPLIAKKIDEIHDELREITPIIQRIDIVRRLDDGTLFSPVKKDEDVLQHWVLMPSDRSYAIQFAPDQLLMFSKKYTRYEAFEEILVKALDVLIKHMRFIDVTSMGVRYIDHIKCRKGEEFEEYIDSSLLPPHIEGMSKSGGIVTGTYKLKNEVELRIKSVSQPDALSVPEDLIAMLAITQDPKKTLQLKILNGDEMLLDIDSLKNIEIPKRLDKTEITNQLKSLHKEANNLFRNKSVCTDHAFKVWKGGG